MLIYTIFFLSLFPLCGLRNKWKKYLWLVSQRNRSEYVVYLLRLLLIPQFTTLNYQPKLSYQILLPGLILLFPWLSLASTFIRKKHSASLSQNKIKASQFQDETTLEPGTLSSILQLGTSSKASVSPALLCFSMVWQFLKTTSFIFSKGSPHQKLCLCQHDLTYD